MKLFIYYAPFSSILQRAYNIRLIMNVAHSYFHVSVSVCSPEEQAQRYAVPTYEEAVSSGQYPVSQSNIRTSTSQLPSYEDLVQVDQVQYEAEGSEASTPSQPAAVTGAPAVAAVTSNGRPGRNSRKLLPIKIRRIKSEKLRMKNVDPSQSATGISVEPLTPPPQYEDKVPPI